MGLHEIVPGLGNPTRRLIQNGKSAAKVTLTIAPGDEVVVSEDVAAQLEAASGSFQEATPDKREAWDGIIADAQAAAAEPEVEPVKKPSKRAAKKAAEPVAEPEVEAPAADG